jgi:hypothetical protein
VILIECYWVHVVDTYQVGCFQVTIPLFQRFQDSLRTCDEGEHALGMPGKVRVWEVKSLLTVKGVDWWNEGWGRCSAQTSLGKWTEAWQSVTHLEQCRSLPQAQAKKPVGNWWEPKDRMGLVKQERSGLVWRQLGSHPYVGDSHLFCVKEQGSGVHDKVVAMS